MSTTYSSTLWPQPFGISYHRTIRLPYSNLRSSLLCGALICSTPLPYCSLLWYQALCVNEFKGAIFECGSTPDASCQKTGERAMTRSRNYYTSAIFLNQLWLVESCTADPSTYPFRLFFIIPILLLLSLLSSFLLSSPVRRAGVGALEV